MRRFINTTAGKALSVFSAAALLVPIFTFGAIGRASSQISQTLPEWAVVDFAVKVPSKGGANYGKIAAEAVAEEMAKTNKVLATPMDTIARKMTELGLENPLTSADDQIRLGQSIPVSSVVSGSVVDYRVVEVGNGKQGQVVMDCTVRDVASGLVVNGAAVKGNSAVRTGDVTDDALVTDAIKDAAFKAVTDVWSRTLPNATVLNTTGKEALINHGARSGFIEGQEIVVLRGRLQVASGKVTSVDPDSATIKVERQQRGVQPGDKVRVVFTPPTVTGFAKNGDPKIVQPKKHGNNSGLISMLVVVAAVLLLVGGGRGGGQDLVSEVTAEALMLPDDRPAVQINWRPDGFVKGNQQRYKWQVYRSDVPGVPVIVVDGNLSFAIDDNQQRPVTYSDFGGIVGGFDCTNTSAPTTGPVNEPGVVPGTPYNYSVELIYKLSVFDLPGSGTTGGTTGGATTGLNTGGGTTGLNTGGGTGLNTTGLTGLQDAAATQELPMDEMMQQTTGTTGTTTGTTGTTANTTGNQECYFASVKTAAKGYATPINRPVLRSPENNAILSVPTPFSFISVKGPVGSAIFHYVLELSPNPQFPGNQTKVLAEFDDNSPIGTVLSTVPIKDVLTVFPGSNPIYWRIGARNVADFPGPVPVNGERYIFSAAFRFSRPTNPPIPPLEEVSAARR